ncbi:MAG TPA: ABC transporter permease [Pseudogracilibacillus sp.]|nr:ABC transporter permease [Pseudogracilibacillus sp.]
MGYVIRRIVLLAVTLVLVSLITFFVFQIMPGNPARIMLGTEASESEVLHLEKQLGLDEPLLIQYKDWVKGILTADFGQSIKYSQPVSDLIISRLPVTLSLALMSIIMVVVVAIPLGVFMAQRQNKLSDLVFSSVTQLGMAIPPFWFGMLLIMYLGMVFSFFSVSGYVPWSESVQGALGSLLLPAITIALPQIAVKFRYVRNSILEQIGQDYVRTAESRGLGDRLIMFKHVLKNAMIPVLTIFGIILAEVVAGTVIVEQVFGLPGLGSLLVSSINYRDFPLVQGIVIYITLAVVIVNFIIDLLYTLIDPRIRLN